MDRSGFFLDRFRFPLTHAVRCTTFFSMAQENNSPRPLLLISDAISGTSGLARIARDLGVRIHKTLSDVYRLGTAGYGASGSRQFPFPQYHIETDNWVITNLPEIVEDFAGDERCTILWIWDLHRLSWVSQPDRLGADSLSKHPRLHQWLKTANIEKWGYIPLDSSGPNDKLSLPIALTALGFDRLLAYGPFGEALLRRSIGDEEANKRHLTNLPHGIDGTVFKSIPKSLARCMFFQNTGALPLLTMLGVNPEVKPIADDELLCGCICTNQSRKDLALACEAIAILSRQRKTRFWLHTDTLERAWSIPTLLADYGIMHNTVISLGFLPDERLAMGYSACNVTIGPGAEGFGFPLLESQFCGTPVVATSCAGGSDVVPKAWQVDPIAFRYEGSYASKRPVHNPEDWAKKINEVSDNDCSVPRAYDWDNLWRERWEPWFREAVK